MATASTPEKSKKVASRPTEFSAWKSVLLPYGLAILAQLPMLLLYFKSLWEKPHYQSFPFAIIASAVLVWMRWPRGETMPFHRSVASDVLMVIGLCSAVLGVLFVEPWFSAFSVLMLVTSLLARTYDPESKNSLWTCALPLFVCLALPMNYDTLVITRLQYYSAGFTSQLLDLIGLGHHLDGTVINVPGEKSYGVEEACSGVVSFFTLLAVTSAYVVWARRIATPNRVLSVLLILAGVLTALIEYLTANGFGYYSLAGFGLILIGILGFRAALLLMSAVFWALFMNTVRILVIPVADYINLGIDLSQGIAHDLLGYFVLIVGILLVLSTDQFLLFMFGPVDDAASDARPLTRSITKFWNRFIAGNEPDESENRSRSRSSRRKPIGSLEKSFIWAVAIILVIGGLFQLVDVQRSFSQPDIAVRFFDADVTTDFEKNDLPEEVAGWKQVNYISEDRSRGSDLGQRSDIWQFRAPRCMAVTSLDQTFPGWHELTTCYKNQGWNLVSRKRVNPSLEDESIEWPYIEAHFEKTTGEKGYLLFSHFDAFGEPVDAPAEWGSVNSFIIRARNRLSHRIRANLFKGEVYQTQVFLRSFRELDDGLKDEIKDRYLKIREIMREKFKEKQTQEVAAP